MSAGEVEPTDRVESEIHAVAPIDELEVAAKRVAASAPLLSADQRARLAFLLGGASR
ncbi:hypothetical protein [Arthrobacter alpinus]|uniref:hypothetical protein n=1 Tax=Arthrobacter alpinus TaxID=656366 RepID=UPI0012FF2C1A|nr:hypothetical protein [Arthrobacter alpinus]